MTTGKIVHLLTFMDTTQGIKDWRTEVEKILLEKYNMNYCLRQHGQDFISLYWGLNATMHGGAADPAHIITSEVFGEKAAVLLAIFETLERRVVSED
jgi:hypothetical protein